MAFTSDRTGASAPEAPPAHATADRRTGGSAPGAFSGQDPADRALMARSLAYLFAAAAALALVSLELPQAGDQRAFEVATPFALASAVATALVITLLLSASRVLNLWAFQLILFSKTTLISAAIYFSGGITSTYVMFYVLVALYACYFFSRTWAAIHIAFAGLAYGAVILAHGAGDAPFARWLTTIGTLMVAGSLIRMLKERVERLIERLQDAARTDVLTGLLNRRGFQESFENELERSKRNGRPVSIIVGDIDGFKSLNDRYGHKAGDRALEKVSTVLLSAKRQIDTAARIGGEEFAIIVPETEDHGAYILAERLRRAVGEAFGSGEPQVTISFGVASFPKIGATTEALLHAGDQALYAAKELGRDRTVIHNPEIASALAGAASRRTAQREGYLATLLALAEALDVRDSGTARHSKTVAQFAELTARELDLPDDVVDRVRIGGMLHDVGKIGVPDSVLRKPGPLSPDDWVEMRKHPEIAARILDSATIEDIRAWVLCHHERPDGTGYPNGLTDDEIPLQAKILAVADAYEAMTSDRVYRGALSAEEARDELRRAAGTQFDERVVDAFMRVLDRTGPGSIAHATVATAAGNGSASGLGSAE